MNDIKNTDERVLFVKFIEEEFIEDFLEGKLYTNNLKYFQDLELKRGLVGIGDKFDGMTPIFGLQDFSIYSYDKNELLFKSKTAVDGTMQMNGDEKVPVFCLYEIRTSDLELESNDNKSINFRLKFDSNKKDNIISEFGDKTHAVLIDVRSFLDELIVKSEENKMELAFGSVKYYTEGINNEERLEHINKVQVDRLFWKRDIFKKQKEFRVIFHNNQIDSGEFILKLDSVKGYATVMEINEFLNGDFLLSFGKKLT